ncbi:MAG: ATP-binding protein [bacterium]|nr:ATP-binding protein [Acidimicrobiia bacterium]MCY4651224.1 ATP-binding protein [bacterium]
MEGSFRFSGQVERHIRPVLDKALDHFRVVVLHGARQSGKTTLARLVAQERGGTYVSLDDELVRNAALSDPLTVLQYQPYPLVIDEVQLAGDRLVRTVKRLVDEDPVPGRFLLTGSTNFLTVPVISESLAGRVNILNLRPFSQAEMAGRRSATIERWFQGRPDLALRPRTTRRLYFEIACAGGYPEAVRIEELRNNWFEGNLQTVVQRDLIALADIRREASLEQLLRWTAALTATELNVSEVSRRLGISRPTVVQYLEWLDSVFLVRRLPSWSRNLANQVSRRPKLHVTDSGLTASLMGATPEALAAPTSPTAGPLLENFVINEVSNQLSAGLGGIDLFHLRHHRGKEVDLILERRDGTMVAVEIKATQSPSITHLRHLAWLRNHLDSAAPGSFRSGVLLHTGRQNLKLGDRLFACPIDTLWTSG